MYKLGVIGDKDSVYGFSSVGLSVFFAETAAEAAKTLRAAAEDYAVIFITEKLASQIPAELARYKESIRPAVIPIPGVTGNTGMGMKNISSFVEQAVGSDILPD